MCNTITALRERTHSSKSECIQFNTHHAYLDSLTDWFCSLVVEMITCDPRKIHSYKQFAAILTREVAVSDCAVSGKHIG